MKLFGWLILLYGCLISCDTSKRIKTNQVISLISLDSLILEENIVVSALIDTVSKSKYFLTVEVNKQADTINLQSLILEGTFPKVIWDGTRWTNQFVSSEPKRYFLACQVFSEVRLIAFDIINGKPKFFIPLGQDCITNSAFILDKNGFEVPIIRGEDNGKSAHYDFDLNLLHRLRATSSRTESLLDSMLLNE